ncbi:MAG TPA: acyltransferase [Chitinophagaceae bacterium]|nr:acyltransferase [Chitinophagaceae bacterium]
MNRVHYPALDGLRGIAILMVLFHHNFNFIPLSKFAWIGVDLFFVLSGFLVTEILLNTNGDSGYLRNFYVRRILRIFPIYYLTIIVFFIVARFFSALNDQYIYYHNNQWMLWMYMQNWLFIFKPPPSDNFLFQHFWSLAIEEQFYLIWPFIILICKNQKKLLFLVYIFLAGCILFRIFCWIDYGANNLSFNLQYKTRIDGLCIGSIIAIWKFNKKNIKIRIIRLSIILISIHLVAIFCAKTMFKNVPHFNFFGFTSISVIFGMLLVYGLESKNQLTKNLLANPAIRYIGKISYGLYIFHYPVLMLFRMYSFTSWGLKGFWGLMVFGSMALIIAFITSSITYHFFERKILAIRDSFTKKNFPVFQK